VGHVGIGDDTTARASAAIRLHSKIKRDASSVRNDPQLVWQEIVESVRASCAQGFTPPELKLDDALVALRRVSDNAVQRALDDVEDRIGLPA
jgi:hypothetical protein